jgi:hypothetical protein
VVLLALFIVGYATYRFALVRAGRYPAGKAYLTVGAMVLSLGVITGIVLEPPRLAEAAGSTDLGPPLASPDPVLRAVAAELVRYRPRAEGVRHAARLVALLEDAEPAVRREAHASLVTLVGDDVGVGAGALARWQRLLVERGLVDGAR